MRSNRRPGFCELAIYFKAYIATCASEESRYVLGEEEALLRKMDRHRHERKSRASILGIFFQVPQSNLCIYRGDCSYSKPPIVRLKI